MQADISGHSVFRFKQFCVSQQHAAMKVGTDSDLLGALASGGNRILDIGTGTGVLALMMAQRFPRARVEAVEIDSNAVLDARENFAASPFAGRLTLHHASFQEYVAQRLPQTPLFDAAVCNPPYFNKSLTCPDGSRTRARHTNSLPFEDLVRGAYRLIAEGGHFSVILPSRAAESFVGLCQATAFALQYDYQIKTVPRRAAKRCVLVFRKGASLAPQRRSFCMRNADGSPSAWYQELMQDFLLSVS